MTIGDYNKWSFEIRSQPDLIISTQQYMRICNVFVQDVWLDCRQIDKLDEIKVKADIMFELQGHFVK